MRDRDIFTFGAFTLDVRECRLSRDGTPIHVPRKAHELLVTLVRDAGRLVTKDQLLARVWPDTSVEEGVLTVHMSALRKALGDSKPATYIETVSRVGYRFIAPVAQLPSPTGDRIARRASHSIELSDLVGRGRSQLLSASMFGVSEALTTFRAAIDVDSRYAPAHAGFALARCAQASVRAVSYANAYAEAKTSALRALALDSGSADAQTALGTVLFLSEWDWAGAERSFARALDTDPAHVEALLQYGSLLDALGRLDDSLGLKQRALERDSNSLAVFIHIAMSYWHRRQFDDVITWTDRALAIDPRHVLAAELLLGAWWKLTDIDRLLGECVRRAENAGVSEVSLHRLRRSCEEKRIAFARGGLPGFCRQMLSELPAGERGPVWIHRAVLHGGAGDCDAAFVELDRGLDARDPSLVHLAVAPQWDSLRDDPRFADRLRSMALPFAD